METAKIDFVITWVDGADPIWYKEKLETLKKQGKTAEEMIDNSTSRYRDWDILKYWFRGVEKFAPWVNQIHWVCQVFCVSFEKIFWGGNPPRSYTWILSRVNSLK